MKYKETSDKELWERCRSLCDERAFDELFHRYYKSMLRTVSRRISDRMTAEELVMDSFFNLWVKREQLMIEGDFLNYLFTCVYNSVLYHLRKELPETVDLESVENKYKADHRADTHLLYEDFQNVYNVALQKLSPRRRQAFLLSREENLTYAEIAQRMNVSEGVVKNYMNAALDGLRVSMKECISVLVVIFASVI